MVAKTVITDEPKPFAAPISYTFRNEKGDEVHEMQNYRVAKYALDKQTGRRKGFKLKERRL